MNLVHNHSTKNSLSISIQSQVTVWSHNSHLLSDLVFAFQSGIWHNMFPTCLAFHQILQLVLIWSKFGVYSLYFTFSIAIHCLPASTTISYCSTKINSRHKSAFTLFLVLDPIWSLPSYTSVPTKTATFYLDPVECQCLLPSFFALSSQCCIRWQAGNQPYCCGLYNDFQLHATGLCEF